jgi:hypothetical protein
VLTSQQEVLRLFVAHSICVASVSGVPVCAWWCIEPAGDIKDQFCLFVFPPLRSS